MSKHLGEFPVVILRVLLAPIAGIVRIVLPWLKLAGAWISMRLRPQFYERISPNAKCPGCGHRKGKIQTIEVLDGKSPVKAVQHTCAVCSCQWLEQPIDQSGRW